MSHADYNTGESGIAQRRTWTSRGTLPIDGPSALREPMSFQQWLCRALPPILSYRLADRIFLRKRPPAGEMFVTTTITGALFSFRSGDVLADQVRMCGFWDWRALAIAATFCGRGDTIIEIGANTGTETAGFAQIVGRDGKVVAFEPLPYVADSLRHNVAINQLENVATIEAAVTDIDGYVTIQPPSATNSGQGFITKEPGGAGISVRAVTLDSMIDELGPAALMLLDVEGYEVSVLRGAKEYIRRHRPPLIVEAVAGQLTRAGSSLERLARELASPGYTVYQINRISVCELDLKRCGERYHRNWLCIPNERQGMAKRVNMFFKACAFLPKPFQPLNALL
jgi:FkbM family methyltransferase